MYDDSALPTCPAEDQFAESGTSSGTWSSVQRRAVDRPRPAPRRLTRTRAVGAPQLTAPARLSACVPADGPAFPRAGRGRVGPLTSLTNHRVRVANGPPRWATLRGAGGTGPRAQREHTDEGVMGTWQGSFTRQPL